MFPLSSGGAEMNRQEVIDICDERLDRWKTALVFEHATPVLLLGVSHDHNSGKCVLCTTEEMSDSAIRLFLEEALTLLG